MWLAFIIALALELLKPVKKVTTALKYIVASAGLSTFLSLALTLALGIFYPSALTEAIDIWVYLFIIAPISAFFGLVTAIILRGIAGAK